MNFEATATVFAALVVSALTAIGGPALAKDSSKNITWNIKTAGDFMRAAADIPYDDGKASGVDKAPKRLAKYDLIYYQQLHRRFKEDLNFIIAASESHVFIAFAGTTYTKKGDDAHTKMNNDGQLNLEHGHRIHLGWWRAAEKAWEKEIRPVLAESGKGRKTLITGHSMGGVMAAYVAQQMLYDADMKDWPIRLVTFGTPRYTLSRNFFRRDLTDGWYEDDFYVYTVEATKKNRCVDFKVYEWQKALRENYPITLRSVDLKTPKNKKGDNVWYGRCLTDITNYSDLHSSTTYHAISQGGQCRHIDLRSDCKKYKSYVD